MAVVVDETVREFLVESHENLDQLDHEFVALEAEPGAQHRIAAIFRTIHTVKGTSGFLGFSKLEHLTHAGENLLSKVRDGVLTLNPPMTSALLALVDKVRKHLAAIEATGVEGDDDMTAIVARLNAMAEGKQESLAPHPAPKAEASAPAAPTPPAVSAPVAVVVAPPPPAVVALPAPPAVVAVPAPAVVALPPPVAVVPAPAAAASAPAAPAPRADASTTNELVAVGADGEPRNSTVSDTSVRVDVHLLDRLMNLVGELVLARNQILQCAPAVEDSAGFTGASQRLNLITTELQEGVMKTRMQPIGNVWNKLPRVVRDLSVACSKQVRIEMVGKETELDRTIIEAIKDPLTHIVRNAVDHGIEAPSVRLAKGKARTGTLTLRAYHEGGQVIIEVSDDGGGIDAAAVRQKAISQGLISAERGARMTDRELHQLVFVPGFSTAAKVSNVSGRGVGMDVVKTNIEKIGGTVDLQVREGAGTTLKIKIPLTLAIVPALIVTSGGYRFAIPQVSLLELVRLDAQKAKRDIESIHGAPVYRLRGNLLPLVHLDRALAIPHSTEPSIHDDAVSIVVLQADEQQFGLIVDDVKDTEEIVVKPLGKELKSIAVFAGATVMGDGGVALILDVLGLAQHAGAASGVRERAFGGTQDSGPNEANGAEEKQTLLLFRVGAEGRLAVPLSLVARLEEFTADRVEHAGGQRVVQYRGEIMPLLELREALGIPAGDAPDPRCVSVVVYSENGRSVGLVVDQILDIVDEVVAIRHRAGRWGIAGAAVIQGKVTELLDLRTVLQQPDTAHHTETRAA